MPRVELFWPTCQSSWYVAVLSQPLAPLQQPLVLDHTPLAVLVMSTRWLLAAVITPLALYSLACADVCCLQVRQIERRWALQEAAKYSGSRLLRTADAYESAVGFVDASKTDDWRLLHLNAPAVEMLGAFQDTCSRLKCWVLRNAETADMLANRIGVPRMLAWRHASVQQAGRVFGWADTLRCYFAMPGQACSMVTCVLTLAVLAVHCPTGVDWRASYDDLAKLAEGRHFNGFEGVHLNKLLDINMGQAVSTASSAPQLCQHQGAALLSVLVGCHLRLLVLSAWRSQAPALEPSGPMRCSP
jgi:hypothetical protein